MLRHNESSFIGLGTLGFNVLHHTYVKTYIMLAIVYTVFFLYVWKIYLRRLSSPLKGLPGPKVSYTLLGNSKAVFSDPVGKQISNWLETIPNKGLIYFRGTLGSEYLVPTSVEALADVLCNNTYDYTKTSGFRKFTDRFIGQGLLTAEGELHRQLIRLGGPVFIERRINDLKPILSSKARQLCQQLLQESVCVNNSLEKPEHKIIDLAPWASRVALDVSGIVSVGVDYNTISDKHSPMFAAYQIIFSSSENRKAHFTWHNSAPRFLLGLKHSKLDKEMDSAINSIRKTVKQVAEDNKKRGEKTSNGLIELDFMSQMISTEAFGTDTCIDQTLLMLAAGHETTSATICWLVLELAKNAKIQSDLRAEVLDFLRQGSMDSNDFDNLPILNAVCCETLRLHPGVPMTLRKSIRNTYIQDQLVPAGSYVAIVPVAINTCTQFWGENAKEFCPERWLKKSADGTCFDPMGGAPSKHCFQTFLHGPRGCIGRSIAIAEIKRVIATLLTHFSILPDLGPIPDGGGIIASHPKGGANAELRTI
nr:cytochrome P450 [Fusarium tricinctum]